VLVVAVFPPFRGAPFGVGTAQAATYNVAACNSAGGVNHSWSQWWNSGVSTITSSANLCSGNYYDGNTNRGLVARYVANSTDPSGAAGGWTLNVGGGNNISSVTLSDWFGRANNNGPYAILTSNYGPMEGCYSGNTVCSSVTGDHTLPANGATSLRTEVGCAAASGCLDVTGIGTAGVFAMYDVVVNVHDLTTPTNSGSGSLWTSAWQRGTQTATVAGSDAGDGIQKNALVIDGATVASQAHGCDYTYTRPCADQTDRFTYNTGSLSDGTHTAQIVSWDGAQDTPLTVTRTQTINVDNHAPSKPATPAIQGTTGWHAANGFRVSWTDPSQGAGSAIAAVHYSLCSAANPANCSALDQRVAGTAINSLDSVNVPGPGDWILRAWLEDAAGNLDSGATSDPVHLMYDPQAPGAAEPAHNNGWLNAANIRNMPEPISLAQAAQTGPSGVAGYAVSLDGSEPGTAVNLRASDAAGDATYSIADLPEGRNVLKARAISGAGVASTQVGSTEIDVDKTPPATHATGVPDQDEWRRTSVNVTFTGSDQAGLSGMAPSSDSTVQHGAYISYRVDGAAPALVPGDHAAASVGGDGDHTVTYQAYDFAGNPSAERSVRVRIDATAPSPVVFEAPIPGDPRRLIVAATDKTSGIAAGAIEMRKQGATTWAALPTARLNASKFTTYLDDTKLDPHATYEFRARVTDAAGNEGEGATYANGAPVLLPGQLRTATRVALWSPAKAPKCKPKRHKAAKRHSHKSIQRKGKLCGRPHRHHHPSRRHPARRSALEQAIATARSRHHHGTKRHLPTKPHALPTGQRRVPFGKSTTVNGTLTNSEGAPVGDQVLAVYATLRAPGSETTLESQVRTDRNGAFRYVARPGASRTLDFRFEGTGSLYPSERALRLLVPASTTLRPSRRAVLNGRSVTFRGRLRGRPFPATGKLVNLQVHYRGRWRTFATPRANSRGAWKFTYRFQATHGLIRYRFRAQVKREAAYSYELGYSKPVTVTVKG
jgi:hypothetical protein